MRPCPSCSRINLVAGNSAVHQQLVHSRHCLARLPGGWNVCFWARSTKLPFATLQHYVGYWGVQRTQRGRGFWAAHDHHPDRDRGGYDGEHLEGHRIEPSGRGPVDFAGARMGAPDSENFRSSPRTATLDHAGCHASCGVGSSASEKARCLCASLKEQHEAAHVHRSARRRSSGVAARGARAAGERVRRIGRNRYRPLFGGRPSRAAQKAHMSPPDKKVVTRFATWGDFQ